MKMIRPAGIIVLAVLQALSAIGWIAIGALVTFGGAFSSIFVRGTGTFVAIIGLVLLITGMVGIVAAYGLWMGKAWARSVCLVLISISIVFDAMSLITGVGLIRLLIDALIIYYITRPKIKEFFAANNHRIENREEEPSP